MASLRKISYFVIVQTAILVRIVSNFFPNKKDLKELYGNTLERILQNSDPELFSKTTPGNVYQKAQKQNRDYFEFIIKDNMLNGSRLSGHDSISQIHDLAKQKKSILVLSAHFGNFDVPSLYTLFKNDPANLLSVFEDMIFIAGRKLTEECVYVKSLAEMFDRVVISAKPGTTKEEKLLSNQINKAALKKIHELKNSGKIFVLYPTGTRARPHKPESFGGRREIYSYIEKFEYIVCLGMKGNLLPTIDERPMIKEIPVKSQIMLNFGEVIPVKDFLMDTKLKCSNQIDFKQFTIDTIMDKIYALGDDPRKKQLRRAF